MKKFVSKLFETWELTVADESSTHILPPSDSDNLIIFWCFFCSTYLCRTCFFLPVGPDVYQVFILFKILASMYWSAIAKYLPQFCLHRAMKLRIFFIVKTWWKLSTLCLFSLWNESEFSSSKMGYIMSRNPRIRITKVVGFLDNSDNLPYIEYISLRTRTITLRIPTRRSCWFLW